jgi:Ca2+-binding RTX toxin-like protein
LAAIRDVLDLGPGEQDDLSSATRILRRDVILGGPGNDVLSGGSGEEWIFGGPGNDVLSGGLDRQASDELFGEGGDDVFQIIPDRLPLIKGTQRTFIPTLSDQFDGSDGTDEVQFLGGDFDRFGRAVPDSVAIRYNTKIHRYEFTSLVWDTANREFVRDADGRFAQEYLFYQPRNIERTVTYPCRRRRSPRRSRLPVPRDRRRMGYRARRSEQGASSRRWTSAVAQATTACSAAPMTISSMAAPGWTSFSAERATTGSPGGDGDDQLAGDGEHPAPGDFTVLPPDAFEYVTLPSETFGRNDSAPFAAQLGPIGANTVIDGLNFSYGDTGDWYIIKTPDAARTFGADRGLPSPDMIQVLNQAGQPLEGFDPARHLFLFPAVAGRGSPSNRSNALRACRSSICCIW